MVPFSLSFNSVWMFYSTHTVFHRSKGLSHSCVLIIDFHFMLSTFSGLVHIVYFILDVRIFLSIIAHLKNKSTVNIYDFSNRASEASC